MIKMLTVHTSEVEDGEVAAQDILQQLQGGAFLLKNTVGILFCYLDFIESGAAEAVCKALPFDTLGCTTLGLAAPGLVGDSILTLTVLTSDDVAFHTALSDPLTEDEEGRIVKVYQEASASLQSSPALILVLIPGLFNLAGDMVVDVLNRESRGVPVFGGGALDVDTKIRKPLTIYGGKAYPDRMPLLLFSGPLAPRFFVDSVWKYNIYSKKALITAVEGNRMIEVNNIPAAEYMKKIGLITEKKMDMLFVFPLAIDTGRGSLSLFIIYTVNDDESLTCSVNIPVGSTLYIGSPGSGEVLRTVKNITDAVKKADGEAALILSCFSRSVILTNLREEMEAVQEELANSAFPFLFLYSGGEVCPVYDEKGAAVNQYHNYSIVSCILGSPPREGDPGIR
jgi:hypothetical protein